MKLNFTGVSLRLIFSLTWRRRRRARKSFYQCKNSTVPCFSVGVTVAEVVHVHAVLLQAAGALLHAGQEASPVAPPLSVAVEPPGHGTAVCHRAEHFKLKKKRSHEKKAEPWQVLAPSRSSEVSHLTKRCFHSPRTFVCFAPLLAFGETPPVTADEAAPTAPAAGLSGPPSIICHAS